MPVLCFCVCHQYPGVYPTDERRPCFACGHVHSQGKMIGSIVDGWQPNVIWVCPDCGAEYIEGEPPPTDSSHGQRYEYCDECGHREYFN